MPFKSLSKNLKRLFWSRMALAFSFGISFPFIPIYFEGRGLELGTIGFLMGANLLAAALGHLLGGPLTDGLGPKATMIWAVKWRSWATLVLSILIYLESSPPLVAAFLLASSFSGHVFQPASDSYITFQAPAGRRTHAFSSMRVAVNAGWALGPAAGGLLAGTLGYGFLFFLTGLMTLLNAFILERKLEAETAQLATLPMRRRLGYGEQIRLWSGSLKDSSWTLFLKICFLSSLVYSQLFTMLGLYLVRFQGQSEVFIGFLFAWNGALVVLTQIAVTKGFQRYALTLVSAAGLVFYMLGYGLLGFSQSVWAYFVAVTIATLGEVIHAPAMTTLTVNFSSSRGTSAHQGSYIALAQFMGVMGSFVSSVLTGYLLESVAPLHPALPWLTIALLAALAALSYLVLHGKIEDKEILGIQLESRLSINTSIIKPVVLGD